MNLLSLMLVPMGLWEDFLGVLGAMMQPLYWAVSGILVGWHSLLSNVMNPSSGWTWALSIVLLTVVIRIALIPLFVRQIQSSRNMQLLGPKVKELNEKYSHDRERLGQETMKLYKEEGVNPMASCLPLFLQMPIFLALFYVLLDVSNGKALGWFFEQNPALVTSLQNATIFGAPLAARFLPLDNGFGATQWLTLTLIILMTGVLFITQLQLMRKNMPPEAMTGQMAQQQKMMLYMFPAIYAIGGVSIPIGVLIYWLTSNLWTMGQQYILIHNNPAPGTPAYVDWEDRMRAKGKDPAEIAARRSGKGRKGRPSTEFDPTKVARQGTTPAPAPKKPDAAPAAGSPPAAPKPAQPTPSSTPDRQVVRRQQPKRNTRATRKPQPKQPPSGPAAS